MPGITRSPIAKLAKFYVDGYCWLRQAVMLFGLLCISHISHAEAPNLVATYLGNEGVMVAQGNTKIVFDPLYDNTYGTYQAVPEHTRTALLNAQPPFDNIQALFVSHAHGDHFSAADTLAFLQAHPAARLIAPAQAIEALHVELHSAKLSLAPERFVVIDLEYGADPLQLNLGALRVEAIRIAHAGGPSRRDIQNILYRVTLADEAVVMHMGDADPRLSNYRPYDKHWQALKTDLALPPYWFFVIPGGETLLTQRLNSSQQIGVHVPATAPEDLKESGADYFFRSGEQRIIAPVSAVDANKPVQP